MIIEWTPEFELGIEKVDFQHRKLIELINRLYTARTTTWGKDNIVNLFDGFSNYCNYHFTIEELVMKKHGYKLIIEHKENHDIFSRRIKLFSMEIQNGNYAILPNVLEFLKAWLTTHIQEEDRKYVSELKNKFIV